MLYSLCWKDHFCTKILYSALVFGYWLVQLWYSAHVCKIKFGHAYCTSPVRYSNAQYWLLHLTAALPRFNIFSKIIFRLPNYLCLFIRFPNLVYTPINKKSALLIKPIANKMFYKPAIVECMDCWKSLSATAEISLLSFPLHLHTNTDTHIRNRHC